MNLIIDVKGDRREFDNFWQKVVGGGYAALALREDYRDHLRDAKEQIGFKYLRIHGIFHDNLGVYKEDEEGNPIYNWSYVDKVYDFLLDIGMKPFVEVGFMPEALMSNYHTHFWWKAITSPPKSYVKWYGLVNAFVKHLVDRYGMDEVLKWSFEIWNEPNLPQFWCGTKEEYFKLYDYSTRAIKDVNSNFIVGGPSLAGGNPKFWGWIEDFITFCKKKDLPFDFISSHTYAVGKDSEEGIHLRKMVIKERVLGSVNGIIEIMKEQNAVVPLHYTEWGSCTGLFDIIQDMEFTAPFILRTLKQVQGKVGSFSYWTHSDIFEEQGIFSKPFGNGFGLINMYGLRKASFNTYAMLNMLGDKELITDYEDCFITVSDSNDEIELLLWNYEPLKEKEQHDRFIYDETLIKDFNITFKNITGEYLLDKYQIDKYHSNVYQKWLELGLPQYPNKEQIEILKSSMVLEKTESKNIHFETNQNMTLQVPKCGAVLLTLKKYT